MTPVKEASEIRRKIRKAFREGRLTPLQLADIRGSNFKIDTAWHNTVAENKANILKMAREGKDKPSYREKLGGFLHQYTRPSRPCYDAEFTKQLKAIRPDWVVSPSTENKNTILKMARKGKDKPSSDSKIGMSLYRYTNQGPCYDAEFTRQLKTIRPDWFVSSVDSNKLLLLKMAKEGKSRPPCKEKLGSSLSNYTKPLSSCYDAEFTNQLKTIRPDWFDGQSITANKKKDEIIEMANSGEARPIYRSKLGKCVYYFTSPKNLCYDPDFTRKLKELRPDWFKKAG